MCIFDFSFGKPIDSYWFEMSCLSCLVFICVHCFFLKMMKLYKDICSAWISRTSADFFHILTSETSQKYNRSIVILQRLLQSVSGRNKCMCCSSHALCYGCVWSYVIHNSFASYDGDVILTCHANKADCQGAQTLSNLIT